MFIVQISWGKLGSVAVRNLQVAIFLQPLPLRQINNTQFPDPSSSNSSSLLSKREAVMKEN